MNTIPQDDAPRKKCANPNCKAPWLPATTKFFHRSNATKDGFNAYCKPCRQAKQKEYLSRPEVQAQREAYYNRPEIQERELARKKNYYVTHHSEIRKQQESYRNRPEIRDTLRAKKRAYYWQPETYERIKAYRHRSDVRKRRQAYDRTYRNQPEIKERIRIQIKTHRSIPEIQRRNRIQAKAHRRIPHVRARLRLHMRNRRVLRKSIPGILTPDQIQNKLKAQRYACYYCSAKFEKANDQYIYHLEHTIPLSRTEAGPRHDVNFVVLACPTCNMKKNNKLPHEWPEGGRLL